MGQWARSSCEKNRRTRNIVHSWFAISWGCRSWKSTNSRGNITSLHEILRVSRVNSFTQSEMLVYKAVTSYSNVRETRINQTNFFGSFQLNLVKNSYLFFITSSELHHNFITEKNTCSAPLLCVGQGDWYVMAMVLLSLMDTQHSLSFLSNTTLLAPRNRQQLHNCYAPQLHACWIYHWTPQLIWSNFAMTVLLMIKIFWLLLLVHLTLYNTNWGEDEVERIVNSHLATFPASKVITQFPTFASLNLLIMGMLKLQLSKKAPFFGSFVVSSQCRIDNWETLNILPIFSSTSI